MKLWIFLAFASVNFACVVNVKMDIYYESLCPDSIKFINSQLRPNYEAFKQHLEITFVPFGKSNSLATADQKVGFQCQHGNDECFGNKVQGCMLSRIPDQDTQVEYVSCQMTPHADRSHRSCVEAFGVDWNEILQCVDSDFATQQQLGFEQVTGPALSHTNWVPTIVYDGKIDNNSHTGRSLPLKDILCILTHNTNPACGAK